MAVLCWQVYEYYITVDVEGVGEELLSIPLKADCQVPAVELESKDLVYGECFVRFHEPRTLVLVNTNEELTGLFRVVPQAASTYSVARVSPEPEEGQVGAAAGAAAAEVGVVACCWLR